MEPGILAITIIFSILGFILILGITLIIIRTFKFKPIKETQVESFDVQIDNEKAVTSLQTLVQCKTISNKNRELEDESEFDKLKSCLKSLYPHVFANTEYTELGDRELLFFLKGTDDSLTEPVVLMAHFDVVPVNESNWNKEPFAGIRENGTLYGRGTIDTKCSLNGALRAVEEILINGEKPKRSIYFAFSGEEEIFGPSAKLAVDYFKENNITPYFVLDEGGAVIENVFPGVSKPCGMIGIAEKGQSVVEFHLKSGGGHASHPKPHTNVGILAKLAVKIEKINRKAIFLPPIKEMFNILGRESTFVYRMIFANLWIFGPVLKLLSKKSGGQMNAIMRTTTALTQMEGSKANNVIPSEAMIALNMRTLPTETAEENIEKLTKLASKYDVTTVVGSSWNPSSLSRLDADGYEIIRRTIKSTFGNDVLVSPYLMTACADARFWNEISDRVYRFTPAHISSEQMNMIHGDNENLTDNQIAEVVEFYYRLIKSL